MPRLTVKGSGFKPQSARFRYFFSWTTNAFWVRFGYTFGGAVPFWRYCAFFFRTRSKVLCLEWARTLRVRDLVWGFACPSCLVLCLHKGSSLSFFFPFFLRLGSSLSCGKNRLLTCVIKVYNWPNHINFLKFLLLSLIKILFWIVFRNWNCRYLFSQKKYWNCRYMTHRQIAYDL